MEKSNETKTSRIVRARIFLEQNKIFFETVAALLLSIMAITLSIAQVYITVQQTDLARVQAEVARQQALPQFVVRLEQVVDQTKNFTTEERILVENRGGIAYDLVSSNPVFFDVVYIPKGGLPQKIEIAVNGYFLAAAHTAQGTGLVLVVQGHLNNEKRYQLEQDLRDLLKAQDASGYLEIRRYLKLSYRDILGKRHTDYYFVPAVFGGSLLSPSEAEPIFAKYDSAFKDGALADIDKLKASDLLARFK